MLAMVVEHSDDFFQFVVAELQVVSLGPLLYVAELGTMRALVSCRHDDASIFGIVAQLVSRSAALTMYGTVSIAEPCTMLVEICQ